LSKKIYVVANAEAFVRDTLFEIKRIKKYDYIISNPPYFKIPKSDVRAQIARELVYGQPNIYSLFLGLSAKLLKTGWRINLYHTTKFCSRKLF